MQIFIDTEFTNFIDTHPISIGLVTESGEEFYAEIPYPDNACSQFVREAVLPQLSKNHGEKISIQDIGSVITEWLDLQRSKNETVTICYDYQADWEIFADFLDYKIPSWCRPMKLTDRYEQLKQQYYSAQKLTQHHALHDARALRYAVLEMGSSP